MCIGVHVRHAKIQEDFRHANRQYLRTTALQKQKPHKANKIELET